MSGRLLKKVLKEQEEEEERRKSAKPESDLNDGDESDSPESPPPSRNPFELLEDDQVDDLDVTDETSTEDTEEQEPAMVKNSTKTLPSSNHKSKKKKKKTKEDPKSMNDKSIDVILQSLNINTKPIMNETASTSAKATNTSSILSVESKFLRPEIEMRRIFGSDVVRSFENNTNIGSSSRQVRGARRGSVHNPRKTFLVSPSSHWPRWDGSLSMELLQTIDGNSFFKYVHTSSYKEAQRSFESARAINDLNSIASLLVYYPYHIDSLLTIAEVLKFSGEHQSAADAISKCLYALECAWHPSFTPLHGNCHLKHTHETNRPLFSVLFTHMQNLDRRGCHRSALEVCKLLLSLDSDDPMGAMFCIDYFSIRAVEYSWLEKFSEMYNTDNSLWLFPNFAYSLAVCRFYLERESRGEDEKASSVDLMKQALMLHPSVLKKLVDKAPLKDSAWGKILKNKFFGSAKPGGPSLEHLVDIYVERSYIVWRLPDLQTLLRDAAQLVIENLDNGDAMDWACVRKEAFPSEKNEYSHLLVSDFSDSVPTMPPDDLRDLMVVDPRVMGNGERVANAEVAEAVRAPREVINRNPVLVFLESILPWADYGGPLEDNYFDEMNRDQE